MSYIEEVSAFRALFAYSAYSASCICGAFDPLTFKKKDRYGIAIHVSICKACGHVYAVRQLPESEVISFYRDSYRSIYSDGSQQSKTYAFEARLKSANGGSNIFNTFINRCGLNADKKTIVEWGCGGGWNLVPFINTGATIYGFDYDHEAVALGKERFGLDLRLIEEGVGIRNVPIAADFLILNHVIEHVINPVKLLAELKEMIKKDGFLYVGLPLIEELGCYGWDRFFHVAHLHYFSIPKFRRVANLAGFSVVYIAKGNGYFLLSPIEPSKISPKPGVLYPGKWILYLYFRYGLVAKRIRWMLNKFPRTKRLIKHMFSVIKRR